MLLISLETLFSIENSPKKKRGERFLVPFIGVPYELVVSKIRYVRKEVFLLPIPSLPRIPPMAWYSYIETT